MSGLKRNLRMKTKMPAIKSTLLNIIAFLEIAGGGWMLGIMLGIPGIGEKDPQVNLHPNLTLVVEGFFIILAAFSIWAGFLLWKRRSLGFSLSAALQFLQIPYIYLGSLTYTFQASLLSFIISITSDSRISFTAGAGPKWFFSEGGESAGTHAIGINIVAIIFLVLILSMRRLVKNH